MGERTQAAKAEATSLARWFFGVDESGFVRQRIDILREQEWELIEMLADASLSEARVSIKHRLDEVQRELDPLRYGTAAQRHSRTINGGLSKKNYWRNHKKARQHLG